MTLSLLAVASVQAAAQGSYCWSTPRYMALDVFRHFGKEAQRHTIAVYSLDQGTFGAVKATITLPTDEAVIALQCSPSLLRVATHSELFDYNLSDLTRPKQSRRVKSSPGHAELSELLHQNVIGATAGVTIISDNAGMLSELVVMYVSQPVGNPPW
jgi:hypothetical protein